MIPKGVPKDFESDSLDEFGGRGGLQFSSRLQNIAYLRRGGGLQARVRRPYFSFSYKSYSTATNVTLDIIFNPAKSYRYSLF